MLDALVWWSLRDLRDRYLRLLQSFREFRGPATTPGKQVFDACEQTLREELRLFENELASPSQQEALNWAVETNNLERAIRIPRDHRREYNQTAAQLFPYIPLGPHPPDDLRFFLMRSLGLSLYRQSHDNRFSLAYSGKPFWEMRELPPSSDEPLVAVVPVPFPESLTPFRWPLLVHELGHVIDGTGREQRATSAEAVAETLLRLFPPQSDYNSDRPQKILIAHELLADAVAFRACGMAYLWAFITEALFQDQLTPWAAHLSRPGMVDAQTRIAVMDPEFKRLPLSESMELPDTTLPAEVIETVHQSVTATLNEQGVDLLSAERWASLATAELQAGGSAPNRPTLPVSILSDTTRLSELRDAVSPPRDSTVVSPNSATIDYLRGELPSAPAPGVLRTNAETRRVSHAAATDAEILTAAWCNYVEGDAEHQRTLCSEEAVIASDGRLAPERLDRGLQRVVTHDTNVARSLESAAVHRWLAENSS